MDFQAWLTKEGYDSEQLTPTMRTHLTAAWKAETAPPVPVAVPVAATALALAPDAVATPYEVELAEARRESARRTAINEFTTEQIRANLSHPERVERFDLLRNAAIQGKWDVQKFQLEMLKEKHQVGPIITVARGDEDITNEVLEAAALRGVGYSGSEKKFNDRVLSAVDKRYRRGIGLTELIAIAAERNNNYRGSTRDLHAMCQAAFRDRNGDPRFPSSGGYNDPRRQDVGPSSIAVPGILSNVANKFLEAGFLYSEQSWRQIAKIRPANDYKEMSLYRMGASAKFELIPPGGEIKHGTLSELSYGLKVDAYGKMLGISEQDMRNDDLGAFAGGADEIGRGGGDMLNDLFWTTHWLDDSTFFPTNKTLANYDDGATDSVLSLAGLDNAESILRRQTKPDLTPLGVSASIILVPPELYNTGLTLMGGQGLVVGTTPASGVNLNVFYGRYRVVSSAYLTDATAWYLLVDPNNIPCISIAFLDGVEVPVVETSMFDFDRLGMAMRGTLRVGVRKQEYRGGVKLKGAA